MNYNINNWKGNTARFLSAQTISLLGSSLSQYAIVWYITLSTSSGKMLTISTLCGFLPQILISLFGGMWADRYSRKLLIMVSDGIIALASLVLAVLFLSGHQDIWFLFAALAVRSAGTGVQTPAVNAVIPQLVPPEYLMRVNGIQSTLASLMMFLSPALGGIILSVSSLETALFADVGTALLGICITYGTAVPYMQKKEKGKSGLGELKKGFFYLRNSRLLKRLFFFQLAVLFFISPSAFLTPLLVSRTFGPEVWRLTMGEMTYSLGMVLGGLLISLWGGFSSSKLHTVIAAAAAYGGLMLGMGTAPFFGLYLVLNTAIGVTSPCYNTPITAMIQETVEPEMQGRVFGFMQIASSCALPLGMAVFGPAADYVKVQYLLLTGGIMTLAVAGYMWKNRRKIIPAGRS